MKLSLQDRYCQLLKVEYLLDFKRIIMRKLTLGIADGKVICDDKIVFEATDIRVGLFQD